MREESLYFIAVLATPEVASAVISIKQEFADRFESSYALKPPPHITLQSPFWMHHKNEENLKQALTVFFSRMPPFKVQCRNFGSFPSGKNPVIFIQPLENKILDTIHKNLMLFLRELGFSEERTPLKFHPHMTVAYRDLTLDNFQKAWPEFEQRHFEADFNVDKIYLLRQDRKKWIPLAGFDLLSTG
ncbi:MAG TPA: 2'-5' RNA ligase family protein [Puia sp.]|nr:2'-5' RNA ligase family protein [Puia sp.]